MWCRSASPARASPHGFPASPSSSATRPRASPEWSRPIRPQTLALTLFAVVAAVAVLLVVGQGLARQTSAEAADYPTLNAIDMTRWQLMAIPLLRAAAVAGVGALLAVDAAVLASRLTPIGYARIAEPHPRFAANVAWLVIGGVALAFAVVLVAVPSAWLATRGLRTGAQPGGAQTRPSWAVGRLARAGAPAPVVIGTQLALDSGRGRTAVPARTAIASVAASIIVVALVLSFSAGLNRLVDQDHRWGQNWDAVVDNDFYPLPLAAVAGAFPGAGVRDYAAGNFGEVVRGGRTVLATGIDGRDPSDAQSL